MHASNYHRAHHGLMLPRVGFDRLAFTSASASPDLPPTIGAWRRAGDHALRQEGAYRRRAEYRNAGDPDAPVLDVLYNPAAPFRPTLRVSFRASMARLLDVETVAGVVRALAAHTGAARALLCELELTLDFPPQRMSELRGAYVPYARAINQRGSWRSIGSRSSATSFRAYEKHEEGFTVARIELVARRDALRRWNIQQLADLSGIAWPDVVRSRLRFLEVAGDAAAPERERYTRMIAGNGVNATLKALARPERERFRRRLQPSPIDGEVATLLKGFKPRVTERGGVADTTRPRRLVMQEE